MLTLAFETSAKAASVALTENGKLLGESYQNTGLTHSQTLMVMAEDLLRSSGKTMADVTAVAVAEGPGSFTGVRIGVAAAKGLSWGGQLPCYGVSTLEAMAISLGIYEGYVCACMDARRSQVYNALFLVEGGNLERCTEDRAIALADLAEEMKDDPRPKTIVGDGARLCFDFLQNAGIPCRLAPAHLVMQNAMSVALEAEVLAADGTLTSAQELQPVYLRPAQAERLRQK